MKDTKLTPEEIVRRAEMSGRRSKYDPLERDLASDLTNAVTVAILFVLALSPFISVAGWTSLMA